MKKYQGTNKAVLFSYAVFTTMSLLISHQSHATIRRVFYWGTQTSYDYMKPQDAIDASSTGDTILIYPNTADWGFNLSKKLIILGNGYNTTPANNNLQTLSGLSEVADISLNAGSDGTVLSGLYMYGSRLTVYSNNDTISRCMFGVAGGASYYVDFEGDNSGNVVNGCYFAQSAITINEFTTSSSTLDLTISNNIFTGNFSRFYIYQGGVKLSGEISNNVFGDSLLWSSNNPAIYLTSANMIIKNNISYHLNLTQTNCMMYNNIGSGTEWPSGTSTTYSGNQQNVASSNLFSFQSTDSPDGRFKIKTNSPAKNAGYDGKDCGVFAGSTPYVLSGIPKIPTIYNASGPSQPTGSFLNVTINTRSNN